LAYTIAYKRIQLDLNLTYHHPNLNKTMQLKVQHKHNTDDTHRENLDDLEWSAVSERPLSAMLLHIWNLALHFLCAPEGCP
jgi:hypothetical protein